MPGCDSSDIRAGEKTPGRLHGPSERFARESNEKWRINLMNKEIANDLERKYMTQEEVALLFRVTPSTVKNWRDAGLLEYFQPTGSTRVLYPREAVEEFEKQHTKKAKILEFKRPAEVKKGKPEVSPKSEKEWRI